MAWRQIEKTHFNVAKISVVVRTYQTVANSAKLRFSFFAKFTINVDKCTHSMRNNSENINIIKFPKY